MEAIFFVDLLTKNFFFVRSPRSRNQKRRIWRTWSPPQRRSGTSEGRSGLNTRAVLNV